MWGPEKGGIAWNRALKLGKGKLEHCAAANSVEVRDKKRLAMDFMAYILSHFETYMIQSPFSKYTYVHTIKWIPSPLQWRNLDTTRATMSILNQGLHITLLNADLPFFNVLRGISFFSDWHLAPYLK